MKDSGKSIKLSSYDDIFTTEESRQEATQEHVQEIPLSELHDFHNHPFKVIDDDRMAETVESVKQHGVLMPAIARPRPEGGYELVSGHRRKHACEQAGLETLPVIVRRLDDDEAVIFMVDSNLQRENILPSERAMAYKMKLDAIKHQGERRDLTSAQVGPKLTSSAQVAEQAGESRTQIQRFIRLTNLIPQLMEMVDRKELAFNPAVELSYLRPEEQEWFMATMEAQQSTPSLSQAQRIKKYSQEGRLSEDVLDAIMSEKKKPEVGMVSFRTDKLQKYFPKMDAAQIEQAIITMLEKRYKARQEHNQAR